MAENLPPSATAFKRFGGTFDPVSKKPLLEKIEKQISDPAFWNDPEKTEPVMRERKRLTRALEAEQGLAQAASDIETLFELAREGESVQQEIEAELAAASARGTTYTEGRTSGNNFDDCRRTWPRIYLPPRPRSNDSGVPLTLSRKNRC